MYAEEETELRDLIIQNLETCGFLNKIKAELRAGVFLALEEEGNLRSKIPLFNKKLDDFIDTAEGKLTVSIVREFLEYFNLNFTLSVFDPEIATTTPCLSRLDLCDQLKFDNCELEGPILSTLLKAKYSAETGIQSTLPTLNTESNVVSGELDVVKSAEPSVENSPIKGKISGNVLTKEKSIIPDDFESEKHHVEFSEKDSGDSSIKESFHLGGESFMKKSDVRDSKKSDLYNDDIFNEAKSEISSLLVEEKSDIGNIFKESKSVSSLNHDPFFDEPLPLEKQSFFSFPTDSKLDSSSLKDKSQSKLLTGIKKEPAEKGSLSSLRDLPSLTANSDWTFSREPKTALPGMDSLKSISSSENSNDEVINLDTRDSLEKKDSDVAESNEDSSEKQINSEESIEEEIEEDFSAGLDDLLNSSLSLGDDVTTDQTVSQVSVVEGLDHVEPCNLSN